MSGPEEPGVGARARVDRAVGRWGRLFWGLTWRLGGVVILPALAPSQAELGAASGVQRAVLAGALAIFLGVAGAGLLARLWRRRGVLGSFWRVTAAAAAAWLAFAAPIPVMVGVLALAMAVAVGDAVWTVGLGFPARAGRGAGAAPPGPGTRGRREPGASVPPPTSRWAAFWARARRRIGPEAPIPPPTWLGTDEDRGRGPAGPGPRRPRLGRRLLVLAGVAALLLALLDPGLLGRVGGLPLPGLSLPGIALPGISAPPVQSQPAPPEPTPAPPIAAPPVPDSGGPVTGACGDHLRRALRRLRVEAPLRQVCPPRSEGD